MGSSGSTPPSRQQSRHLTQSPERLWMSCPSVHCLLSHHPAEDSATSVMLQQQIDFVCFRPSQGKGWQLPAVCTGLQEEALHMSKCCPWISWCRNIASTGPWALCAGQCLCGLRKGAQGREAVRWFSTRIGRDVREHHFGCTWGLLCGLV